MVPNAKGYKKPSNRWLSTGKKIAILAMLQNGIPAWQVAMMEGVSKTTVRSIELDPYLQQLKPEIVEGTRKMLASRFYLLSDKSVDKASDDEKMDKMSAYQLTMMAAVAVDKARLMDGQSTENLAVHNISDNIRSSSNEMDAMKASLIKRFKILDADRGTTSSDGNYGSSDTNGTSSTKSTIGGKA